MYIAAAVFSEKDEACEGSQRIEPGISAVLVRYL